MTAWVLFLVLGIVPCARCIDSTFSHPCNISSAVHILDSDILDLNISFPLLVTPPLKEVTYYHLNSSSSSLITLLSDVTITISLTDDFANTKQMTLFALDNFCGFQQTRDVTTTTNNLSPSSHIVHLQSIVVQFSPFSEGTQYSPEEYTIDIAATVVKIFISSVKGLHNALATLDQLFHLPATLHLPVRIFDYPTYPYRGLLVDVARHFIPLPLLKRTIDGMVASKLSVLHLHLTDASSFPVLLRDTSGYALSTLAKKAAFPANGGQNKFYTLDDLASLVTFARERGIEVIPEIDMPSHTHSWGKAFPDIVVNCSNYAKYQESPLNVFSLDPTHPNTLPMIYEILKQINEVFPSSYIHIGGDEVHTECWMDLPNIPHDYTSRLNLLHDFMSDIFKIVKGFGKVPIGWQDTIDQRAFPHQPQQESLLFMDSDRIEVYVFETNKGFVLPITSFVTPATSTGATRPGEFSDISSSAWAVVEVWKCWQGLAGKAAGEALDNALDVITAACWYLDYDSDLEVCSCALAMCLNSVSDYISLISIDCRIFIMLSHCKLLNGLQSSGTLSIWEECWEARVRCGLSALTLIITNVAHGLELV